jgi:hypothetical protein
LLSTTSIFVGVLGLALIAFMGMRDHAKLREKRRDLLDQSAGLLERGSLNHGSDGFPSLEGRHLGRYVRAEFIPDTMTIKRLPQLWLSLSRLESRPENSEFAVLVRPSGTEFYSLTTGYEHRLEPPAGLPAEILARGSRPSAQRLLDRAGSVIGKILADPKVKEIGVTKKGLRLVWQASEGRRGEHLILRQCVFDDARVTRSDFTRLLEHLDELSVAVTGSAEAPAA